MDIDALMAAGAAKPVEPTPPKGEDVAIIMYTSGTTGDPKGVCLTQISLTIACSYTAGINLYPTGSYLSYLPLAHIFEQTVEHGIWSCGGKIGYFGGDVKKLLDDIAALGPMTFCGVPRVFQRVYDKGVAGIKPPKVAKVLLWMLEQEMQAVRVGSHTISSALFKKIFRKVMGGNVRI
jgi:long-chain acyl-CoA synthetase